MTGGILFLIIEVKLGCVQDESFAQLFLELVCKIEILFLMSYAKIVQLLLK